MTPFQPIRAQAERIDGMAQIHQLLVVRCAQTERALAEAEADHNAMLKMEAFMRDLLDRARLELRSLQDEANGKSPPPQQITEQPQ